MDMLPEPALSPKPASLTFGGNRAFHNFANDYSHITDPNLRRRLALSEIDKVPFGLYHVRAVAVAGVGFLLDSYDIFAINLVTSFLGIVFWGAADGGEAYGYHANQGHLPDPVNQALKASTSAGIIVGQLVFGWLADVFGRRRMYGIELAIIVLSTVNCALASPSPSMTSTGILVFWRVMLGVGIGGDYPLSSVITSEFAPTRWRGAMMASVFSMQGLGQLLSAAVALIATTAFRADFINIADASHCDGPCRVAADRVWRIIVGFGAVPACFALYYRITIPETPRYTFDVAHDVEKADADIRAYMASRSEGQVDPVVQAHLKRAAGSSMAKSVPAASWRDLLLYFGRWKNLRVLLGTTFSWFFLDLAFYGLALNNSVVLEAIGYSKGANLYQTVKNNALGTVILTCAGSLPGYWAAVLTVDTLGRKPLQVLGFLVLTALFCILGFAFHRLSEPGMLALYIIAQFFFNWGPNTTTFIVPGECFPTRYRSTGHGLSAAMGKLGAILAQVISVPVLSRDSDASCEAGSLSSSSSSSSSSSVCSPWLGRLMQLFALFMLCGTLVSLLCIPETRGITLEELAGEEPTSYNAGRNGSIVDGRGHDTPPTSSTGAAVLRLLNPFGGGRPAGFHYPRMDGSQSRSGFLHFVSTARPAHRRRKRRRSAADGNGDDDLDSDSDTSGMPRVGIMMSPELVSNTRTVQNGQDDRWHRRRRKHDDSDRRPPSSSRRRLLLGGSRSKRDTACTASSEATSPSNKTDSIGSSTVVSGPPPPALAPSGPPHRLHPSSSSSRRHDGGDKRDKKEKDGYDSGIVFPHGLSPPPPAAGAGVFPGWGAGWGRIDRGGRATPLEDIRLHDVGSLLK